MRLPGSASSLATRAIIASRTATWPSCWTLGVNNATRRVSSAETHTLRAKMIPPITIRARKGKTYQSVEKKPVKLAMVPEKGRLGGGPVLLKTFCSTTCVIFWVALV